MNIFILKQLKRWLQLAIIMLPMVACSPPDAPFDSKPVDIQSARNLAENIAREANCGSFEDNINKDDISFTCQREINGKDAMFGIHVFFEESEKNKMAADLKTKVELALFKMGAFYIVSAFGSVGEDGVTPISNVTAQDYAGFPGEISIPLKSRK